MRRESFMMNDKTKDAKTGWSNQLKGPVSPPDGNGAFVYTASVHPEGSGLRSGNPKPPAMGKNNTGLAQTEARRLAE
jgi:hypothetical protein